MKHQSNQPLAPETEQRTADRDRVPFQAGESELIKRLRELMGDESTTSFGRRCGLSESLLRKYMSGSIPSADRLVAIADTANVTVDWLATGRPPKLRKDLLAAAAPAPSVALLGDRARLLSAVRAVEEGLAQAKRTMLPKDKAELICAAYDLISANTAQERAQIAQLIRLVA